MSDDHATRLRREEAIRAARQGVSLRAETTDGGQGTAIRALPVLEFRAAEGDDNLGPGYLGLLRILFSPVGEWTEINSVWEGRFLERFAAGAWKKTISERAEKIKSLFQHGADPQVGDKPLGPFRRLEEGERGGYAEVALLDTSYNRDLLPGLKEGLYGASHRFGVMREDIKNDPGPSEYNPDGLPEHTVKEAKLYELGPVTFPAYEGATAGVRSMTDEFLVSCFRSDPDRLRTMFERVADLSSFTPPSRSDAEAAESHAAADDTQDAPPKDDAEATPHLSQGRRETGTGPLVLPSRHHQEESPWTPLRLP